MKIHHHLVKLSDGREGIQRTMDGELDEIVIGDTVFTTGKPDITSRVFHISYLGNVTWEIIRDYGAHENEN